MSTNFSEVFSQFSGEEIYRSVVLVFGVLGIYFLPTFIAWLRDHRNTIAIFLLNLFLGWTLLGWVAALVWSALHQEPREHDLFR